MDTHTELHKITIKSSSGRHLLTCTEFWLSDSLYSRLLIHTNMLALRLHCNQFSFDATYHKTTIYIPVRQCRAHWLNAFIFIFSQSNISHLERCSVQAVPIPVPYPGPVSHQGQDSVQSRAASERFGLSTQKHSLSKKLLGSNLSWKWEHDKVWCFRKESRLHRTLCSFLLQILSSHPDRVETEVWGGIGTWIIDTFYCYWTWHLSLHISLHIISDFKWYDIIFESIWYDIIWKYQYQYKLEVKLSVIV